MGINLPSLEKGAPDPLLAKSVGELIASLNIINWDALLVTDGSGQTADMPAGYSACLILRREGAIRLFHGQVAGASSQEAEARAVFEGLIGLLRLKLHKQPTGVRLHLLTDSQHVQTLVNKQNPMDVAAPKSHPMLWAGIRQVTRLGISLQAHHLPRNSNPLMTWMDRIAGHNRQAMVEQIKNPMYQEFEHEIKLTFPLTQDAQNPLLDN